MRCPLRECIFPWGGPAEKHKPTLRRCAARRWDASRILAACKTCARGPCLKGITIVLPAPSSARFEECLSGGAWAL
jgi:hypothetical protein